MKTMETLFLNRKQDIIGIQFSDSRWVIHAEQVG